MVVSIEWQAFLEIISHGKQIEANIGILFQDKGGKDNNNGTTIVTRGSESNPCMAFCGRF